MNIDPKLVKNAFPSGQPQVQSAPALQQAIQDQKITAGLITALQEAHNAKVEQQIKTDIEDAEQLKQLLSELVDIKKSLQLILADKNLERLSQ